MMLNAAAEGPDTFMATLSGHEGSGGSLGISQAGISAAAGEVFAFHSFNIVWLGLVSIAVAVFLNWKNSKPGYWINMAIVGFADLGLIFFMVIPGVMSITDAWIGPLLFTLALVFSTIGRLEASKG
jgi:hypothetical protein